MIDQIVLSDPTSVAGPTGQYLLVDLTGGTTDACLYLQTVMENAGNYPPNPFLPPWNQLDPTALADLRNLVAMAGFKQASYVDTTKEGDARLQWFLNGAGEALVGLTETLGFLSNDQVNQLAFHPLPIANYPVTTVPLFADAWGINRCIAPTKYQLALDFVNVATSPQVALASLMPPTSAETPQYLTPVRPSVAAKLASIYPVYEVIESLISGNDAAFRIDDRSRQWLSDNASGIRNEILGTSFEFDENLLPEGRRSTPEGIWRRS